MDGVIQPLKRMAEYDRVYEALKRDRGIVQVSGCVTSQKAHLVYGLSRGFSRVLLIAENELKARELYEDYCFYEPEVMLYPAKDLLFYKADVHGNLIVRDRLQVLKNLLEAKRAVVVTSIAGCMDFLTKRNSFPEGCFTIDSESTVDLEEMSHKLVSIGYERCGQVEMPGQFSVRGGILDLYSLIEEIPWRVELWGDEVDSIRSFDPESQRSIENLESIRIYPASDTIGEQDSLFSYFDAGDTLFVIDEPNRVLESADALETEYTESLLHHARTKESGDSGGLSVAADLMEAEEDPPEEDGSEPYRIFAIQDILHVLHKSRTLAVCTLEHMDVRWKCKEQMQISARSINSYHNSFALLVKELKENKREKSEVLFLCASRTRAKRLAEDLQQEGLAAFYSEDRSRQIQPGEILVTYGYAHMGFEYPLIGFRLITEGDVFGKEKKKRKKKEYSGKHIQDFAELAVGDYVVHENHGLGIYRGIEKVTMDGVSRDFIKIEYSGGSNLYILATQLDMIQKYAGSDAQNPRLNKLGGQEWNRTKKRVRAAVQDIARELVALYAQRQTKQGYTFGKDTVWQKEFEEMFPFEETQDQLDAIEATKKDMESPVIMDRLVCGDVGYGKTEVALRAAFKAVQEGKQVAFLVPTTILAQQHYNTFTQRMRDYPVRVDLLCRFRTAAQQKQTLQDLKKGWVDIVIGTHRILSKDVCFKDLGLLVVDEEQRFGVTHKEKIKQLKSSVDVLTLTATPIPRTLHMGLIGIRDMSVLEEPPLDRVPIQTYVMEYSEPTVREAILREVARNGQVYFVYNRIQDIVEMTRKVEALVPEASVAYAHGKMNEHELEKIMYSFIDGEIDVLISTTIVETGLDIANVNTMIIYDADRMGLSQLYQLRGRVGRSSRTAYAFLLYRKNKMLKEVAEKRLSAIREFTELGSGIKIAMRDLEIRGAGNLLGAQQHGHMEAVGYDLYCKMLSEAVYTEKGGIVQEDFETTIDMDIDAFIPPQYIPNEFQKLDIYKRIAGLGSEEDRDDMLEELMDRFGEPPKSVQNLLAVSLLKARAHQVYMTEVRQRTSELTFTVYAAPRLDPAAFPEILQKYGTQLVIRQGENVKLIYTIRSLEKKKPADVLEEASAFLDEFIPFLE